MSDITLSPEANPRAHAIYDSLHGHIDRLIEDSTFRTALESLDLASVQTDFDTLTTHLRTYNTFHQRERRLWALRLGRPAMPQRTDDFDRFAAAFRREIPAGRTAYLAAFQAADDAAEKLDRAGFGKVLQTHLAPFTATFSSPTHPFADSVIGYFRSVGCSEPMLDEFLHDYRSINYDFFGHYKAGLGDIRDSSKKGVAAQLEILNHTEQHGFDYLRGRCGPPAWAITASSILAAAGISISAWVIVAIIATLLALLVAICLLAPSGSWLRNQCNKLHVQLPLFRF